MGCVSVLFSDHPFCMLVEYNVHAVCSVSLLFRCGFWIVLICGLMAFSGGEQQFVFGMAIFLWELYCM